MVLQDPQARLSEASNPGFSISQDDLGKTKQALGLGVAYLGLVLTKTDQASGNA